MSVEDSTGLPGYCSVDLLELLQSSVHQEVVSCRSWDQGSIKPGSEVAEDDKESHLVELLLGLPVDM